MFLLTSRDSNWIENIIQSKYICNKTHACPAFSAISRGMLKSYDSAPRSEPKSFIDLNKE